MFAKSYSAAVDAINAIVVQVEADISDGLPVFDMVGFLASEVREARERVKVSLKNAGFLIPPKHITINLSPANIRKEGSAHDLSIAVCVLCASGYLPQEEMKSVVFLGELGLDSSVHSVHGVLPMVYEAKKDGFEYCIVPKANAAEGAAVEGIKVIAVDSLQETVSFILRHESILPYHIDIGKLFMHNKRNRHDDFSEISGQKVVKRAIEIAAAGQHNILLSGPPGAGKTMIAKRIPGILPELSIEESFEITKVYSVSGKLGDNTSLMVERPFRAPHHSITITSLVGGGRNPKPGEISLATHGVLFLDELPEFNRRVIEVLRQPLEERKIIINRLASNCTYPADFMLVAAMNPCQCGFYPDRTRCHCSQYQIHQYQGKLSQPLLDRIDLCVDVLPVSYRDITDREPAESSEEIQKRVKLARTIQAERYQSADISDSESQYRIMTNALLSVKDIERFCILGKREGEIMKQAFRKLALSARGYHKILKVARTIADLAGSDEIRSEHVSEAICYRGLDRR